MGISRLQEDLLQGFNEERKLIKEQLELFDPLGVSLRQPAARRLLSKSLLICYEFGCYLFSAGMIVVIVFMDKLYPFYLLNVFRHREQFSRQIGRGDLLNLQITVAILLGFIALLFLIIARTVRRVRLKNDILNLAGKHIKTLVGQHLKRKAAIDAIEQRHFLELPENGPITNFPPEETWKETSR